MTDSNTARELASKLIRRLRRHGVDYADVRYEKLLKETLVAEQGRVSYMSQHESAGIGIRVLLKGSWGFASSPHMKPSDLKRSLDRAIDMARAASTLNRKPRPLVEVEPVKARYSSTCRIDPFTVPLTKKLDYLLEANNELIGPKVVRHATTYMDFYKLRKIFCSTEGADIEQSIIESGSGLEVIVQQGNDIQIRSAPNSHHGVISQSGFEHVEQMQLPRLAKTAKKEALDLLRAQRMRPGKTTIILDPTQMTMQLHESCGHAVELDRVLGHELSYAGGSFLTTDKLGNMRYGSEQINITADATIPGGVGTFGFDDEGVPGERIDIVREGRFVGYLSSRETAARIGLSRSGGAMRSDGWQAPPLIRMTNVNLEPGEASLEELMRDIKHGYLLATNRSWSIDDKRLNFQFSTEIGWEIIRGRLGAPVKNPLYTGLTPTFWGACTGVSKRGDWRLFGIPACGKGEPVQLMHTGHGSSYARFEGVSVAAAK